MCSTTRLEYKVALLIVAWLPLGRGVEGQESSVAGKFREAALRAVKSHRGGVFVVEIQGTVQVRHSRVFEHTFTVEQVIKPYRIDGGAYYIPLVINELTSDGKPTLRINKRYLVITRLKFGPYGFLFLDDASDLSSKGMEGLLEELRVLAKDRAVYGSSFFLRYYLQEPLDIDGVRTSHADGFVDPNAFGFTKDELRQALREGKQVLLAQDQDSRSLSVRGNDNDVLFKVVEQLAGLPTTKEDVWVHIPMTTSQLEKRSERMIGPYRMSQWCIYRFYIIVVDTPSEGRPVLKGYMPVISKNDRTVRTLRSLIKDLGEGKEKRGRL